MDRDSGHSTLLHIQKRTRDVAQREKETLTVPFLIDPRNFGLKPWWRERQGDRKRRTSSYPALDRDRPAMCADDPLDNGEPEPAAAASCPPPRRVGPVKALKEMRQVLRGDTDSGIADGEKRLVLSCLDGHRHTPTGIGVAHGILQ